MIIVSVGIRDSEEQRLIVCEFKLLFILSEAFIRP